MLKKMSWRFALVIGVALLGAGSANAMRPDYPTNCEYDTYSKSVSSICRSGDSSDRSRSYLKYSSWQGVGWVNGPWRRIGITSYAYAPAGTSVILGGMHKVESL